jgi:hypothetical protein
VASKSTRPPQRSGPIGTPADRVLPGLSVDCLSRRVRDRADVDASAPPDGPLRSQPLSPGITLAGALSGECASAPAQVPGSADSPTATDPFFSRSNADPVDFCLVVKP